VSVEKSAAQSVVAVEYGRHAHVKLVKHNDVSWKAVRIGVAAAEVTCHKPRVWIGVERVRFVRVISDSTQVRLACQKVHCDVAVQVAAPPHLQEHKN